MELFESICKENYERIYKYIFVMTRDKMITEDITQEVFIIAYKKGKKFLNHENKTAFLYKTAKNLVYENIRQNKKINTTPLNDEILLSEENDMIDTLLKNKSQKINEDYFKIKIINSLSEDKKNLYKEYYIDHNSMKEIAQKRKVSEVSIRMKFVRMRREIKSIVKKLNISEI